MRRRILVPLLLAAATAVAVAAADPREAELAQIRQEIARLETRIAAMRARETSLDDRLGRVRLELELQQIELDEATTARDLAAARVDAAETRIGELETTLVEIREDMRRRLAGLYRFGRQGYLRLFLSLEPDADVLPAIRQLRFLVRRDQNALVRYTATRDELAGQRQRLLGQRREMALWHQRELERHDELVRVRRRHQRMIDRVTAERRRLAVHAERLQDKERKLARLIRSLLEDSPTGLAGTPIQNFRGALDWPIRGDVTSGFGPRLDPRYRTEVPHNGIDIETDPGTEIRAVFPGEILYAALFEGYGPMAVVHHPGRVFTLYAGLGELRVGKGDVLSLGDVIGTATEVLYFEIRVENQPVDPLSWLR